MQESSLAAWQLQLAWEGWQARLAQVRSNVIFVTLPEGINEQFATQLVASWLARLYLGTSHASLDIARLSAQARNYLLGSAAFQAQFTQLVHAHHLYLHREQTQNEMECATSKASRAACATTSSAASPTSSSTPTSRVALSSISSISSTTSHAHASNQQHSSSTTNEINRAEFCYQVMGWELVALTPQSQSNALLEHLGIMQSANSSNAELAHSFSSRTYSLAAWFEQYAWNHKQLNSQLNSVRAPLSECTGIEQTNDELNWNSAVYWLPENFSISHATHKIHETAQESYYGSEQKHTQHVPQLSSSETYHRFLSDYCDLQEQALLHGKQVQPLVIFTRNTQLETCWLPWCRQLHLEMSSVDAIHDTLATTAVRMFGVQVWRDISWWECVAEAHFGAEQLVQLLLRNPTTPTTVAEVNSEVVGLTPMHPTVSQPRQRIYGVTNRALRGEDVSTITFRNFSDPKVNSSTVHVTNAERRNVHAYAATILEPQLIANTRSYLVWLMQCTRTSEASSLLSASNSSSTSSTSTVTEQVTSVYSRTLQPTQPLLVPLEHKPLIREQLSAWYAHVARQHDLTLVHSASCIELSSLTTTPTSVNTTFTTLSEVAGWYARTSALATHEIASSNIPPSQLVPLQVVLPCSTHTLTSFHLQVYLGRWANRVVSYVQQLQRQASEHEVDYAQQLSMQLEMLEPELPKSALANRMLELLQLGHLAPQLEAWLACVALPQEQLGASSIQEATRIGVTVNTDPTWQATLRKIPRALRRAVEQACFRYRVEMQGYLQRQSTALLRNQLLEVIATMHARIRLAPAEMAKVRVYQQHLELVSTLLQNQQLQRKWDVVIVPAHTTHWVELLAQLGIIALPTRWQLELSAPAAQQCYTLTRDAWASADTCKLNPAGGYWGYSLSDLVELLLYKLLTQHHLEILRWLIVQLQRATPNTQATSWRLNTDSLANHWIRVSAGELARYRRAYRLRFIPLLLAMWEWRFRAGAVHEAPTLSARSGQRDAKGKYLIPVALLTQVPALRYELIVNHLLQQRQRVAQVELRVEHILALLQREVKYYLALAHAINPPEYRFTSSQLRKQFTQIWHKLLEELVTQLSRTTTAQEVSSVPQVWSSELVFQAQQEILMLAQIFATTGAEGEQVAPALAAPPSTVEEQNQRVTYLNALQQLSTWIWHTYLRHARAWHTASAIELATPTTSQFTVCLRQTGLECVLQELGVDYDPTQLYYQLLRAAQPCLVTKEIAGEAPLTLEVEVRSWLAAQEQCASTEENSSLSTEPAQLLTTSEFRQFLADTAQGVGTDTAVQPALHLLYVCEGGTDEALLEELLSSVHSLTCLTFNPHANQVQTTDLVGDACRTLPQVVTLTTEQCQALLEQKTTHEDYCSAELRGMLLPHHYLGVENQAEHATYTELPRYLTQDIQVLEQRATLTSVAAEIGLEDLQSWTHWQQWLESHGLVMSAEEFPSWNALLRAWQVLWQYQHALPPLQQLVAPCTQGTAPTPDPSVVTVAYQLEQVAQLIESYNHLSLQTALLSQVVLGETPYFNTNSWSMEHQLSETTRGWLELRANSATHPHITHHPSVGRDGERESVLVVSNKWILLQPAELELSTSNVSMSTWQYAEYYAPASCGTNSHSTELSAWLELLGNLVAQLGCGTPQVTPALAHYTQQQFAAQQSLHARLTAHLKVSDANWGTAWCDTVWGEAEHGDTATTCKKHLTTPAEATAELLAGAGSELELHHQRWSASFTQATTVQQQILQTWFATSGGRELATVRLASPIMSSAGVAMISSWEQLSASPAYQQLEELLTTQGINLPLNNARMQLVWWLSMWFFAQEYSYVQRVLRVQSLHSEARLLEQLRYQQLERLAQLEAELQQMGVTLSIVYPTDIDHQHERNNADTLNLEQLLEVERRVAQQRVLEARQQSNLLIETAFASSLASVVGAGAEPSIPVHGVTTPKLQFTLALESAASYTLLQGSARCFREPVTPAEINSYGESPRVVCVPLATSATTTISDSDIMSAQVTLATPHQLVWVLTDATSGIPLIAGLDCSVTELTQQQRQNYVKLLLDHHCWRRTRFQARSADYGISRLARLHQAQVLAVQHPLLLHQHHLETEMRARVQYRPRVLHAPRWHASKLSEYLFPAGSSSATSRVTNITGWGASNHLLTAWQLQAQQQFQNLGFAPSLGLASHELHAWCSTRHYAMGVPEVLQRLSTPAHAPWRDTPYQLQLKVSSYLLLNYELQSMYQWQDLRLHSLAWSAEQQQQRYAWLGQELVAHPNQVIGGNERSGVATSRSSKHQRATTYWSNLTPAQLHTDWLGIAPTPSHQTHSSLYHLHPELAVHKQLPQHTAYLGLDLLRKLTLVQASVQYQLLPPDLTAQLARELVGIYGVSHSSWLVPPRAAVTQSVTLQRDSSASYAVLASSSASIGTLPTTTPSAATPSSLRSYKQQILSWWYRLRGRTATAESATAAVLNEQESVPQLACVTATSDESRHGARERQGSPANMATTTTSTASWDELLQARDYEQLAHLLQHATLYNRNGQLTWRSLNTYKYVDLHHQQLVLPPHFYTSISGTVAGAQQRRQQELFTYARCAHDYLAPDYLLTQWESDLPHQASYLVRNLRLSPYDCKQMAFSYLFAQACYTMVLGYENKHLIHALQDAYIDPRWVFQCFWGEGERVAGAGQMETKASTDVSIPFLTSRVMYVNAQATLLQMNFARYKLRALDLHLSKQQAQLEVNELLVLARAHYLYWNSLVSTLKNLQACMDGKLGWQYLSDLQQCLLERRYKLTYNFYALDAFTQTQLDRLSEHYTNTITTYTYKAMQLYLYHTL